MKKFLLFLTFFSFEVLSTIVDDRPEDIIPIRLLIPDIKMDIRYFSKRNFVGEEIIGYISENCYLQEEAAKALKKVQEDLKRINLELLLFDCYRPQMAVNHFARWAENPTDSKMKTIFYPNVPKDELFNRGYIAHRSGHSKGNTVDLGIITKTADLKKIKQLNLRDCRTPISSEEKNLGLLEMGTHYDCFDEKSHTMNKTIPLEATENRKVLVNIMEKNGFKNYSKEWWHFSYYKNQYPDTFHNFPVE